MIVLELQELLKRLPRLPQPPVTVVKAKAFEAAPTPINDYVSPQFEVEHWPEGASILLIEAAGAVGKTVLAETLASQLNWPMVRAELAQVGSYSLSGLVQDSLGFGSFLTEVGAGAAGIVIDSLDEAQMRAGSANFLAFLENVAKVAGPETPERSPSLILMSRIDAAETVKLALLEHEVIPAVVRLEFFEYPSAKRFVTGHLSRRFKETEQGLYNVAHAWPKPFSQLLDAQLERMLRIVTRDDDAQLNNHWANARDFIGYAPVLVALAEAVAVSNPANELSRLKKAGHDGSLAILQDVVERILKREQVKFRTSMEAKLQAMLPESEVCKLASLDLYSPEEQIMRLTSIVNSSEMSVYLPATLPNSLRGAYEDAANPFMMDHPFLRKRSFAAPIFSDYVLAAIHTQSRDVASLVLNNQTRLCKQLSVGPFFAMFFREMSGPQDLKLPEHLLPIYLQSWSQEIELRPNSEFAAFVTVMGSSAEVITIENSIPGSNRPQFSSIGMDELSGLIQLEVVPKYVSVVTDQGLLLGSRGKNLSIGSGTLLVASEIFIESDAMGAGLGSRGAPAVMVAPCISADYLASCQASKSLFNLYCDETPPILQGFQRKFGSGRSFVNFKDYVSLRAILMPFRSSVHMGLSVSRTFLDRHVLRSDTFRQIVVAELKQIGVLEEQGEWLLLRSEELVKAGFSLVDLKSGEPTESVQEFLTLCRRKFEVNKRPPTE